ncbi:MAG: GNAT family N-acetyltransferase [Patescibacteria group bacterium]
MIDRHRREFHVSHEGIPVNISSNFDSEKHNKEVSFGIGELTKLGEIQQEHSVEEEAAQDLYLELKRQVNHDARKRYVQMNPDDPNGDYAWPDAMPNIIETILQEEPERRAAIEQARIRWGQLARKRYHFAEKEHYDLWAGKEGTLVYALTNGRQAASQIRGSGPVDWDAKERLYHYGFFTDDSPEKEKSFSNQRDELFERLRIAKRVADIHQIEVLPEYQGRGYAKALLDAALFDIEFAQSGVEFVIARVMRSNPDGAQMIKIFQKTGFQAFYTSEEGWGGLIHDFIVLIRENVRHTQHKALSEPLPLPDYYKGS